MDLKFINKLDNAIFARLNPNHEPVSGNLIIKAFIGGAIVSLIVFILQMTSISNNTLSIVAGVLLIALFAYIGKLCLPTVKAFDGWGGKIGYSLYMAMLTFGAFYLAMILVMVALLLLFLFVIVKIFFGGGSKKSKKWKVTYDDGTQEEAEETGKGICGETYIRTKSGKNYQVP